MITDYLHLLSRSSAQENELQALRLRGLLLVIAEEPAHRLRQESATVLPVVGAGPVLEAEVVLLEPEGGLHLLVRQGPVPVLVVEVARAVLEEDPDGLGRRLPDQRGVDVPAADVGEA